MGKKLIIPGADFSANAIDGGDVLVISSSQTDAGGYWKADGAFVSTIATIKGVEKISIPAGIVKIKFQQTNTSEVEPSCLVFWNGSSFLGAVPSSTTVGLFNPLYTNEFEIPTGATHFSYVYKNEYGSNRDNIGLFCIIVGI